MGWAARGLGVLRSSRRWDGVSAVELTWKPVRDRAYKIAYGRGINVQGTPSATRTRARGAGGGGAT